jgi:hypothetical protein
METPNGKISNRGLTITKVSEGKKWDCDTFGAWPLCQVCVVLTFCARF